MVVWVVCTVLLVTGWVWLVFAFTEPDAHEFFAFMAVLSVSGAALLALLLG